MSTTKFVLNETSYFGNGAREVLAEEITKRGFKKVFLVSDKSLVEAGVAAKVEEELKKANIAYTLYSEIKPNPTIKNVLDGVEACKQSGADIIVAVGGGSSMDTAKGISIVMTNPDRSDIRSLNGLSNTVNKGMPVIAMPTTAGTAAEVTINYVITDEERKIKMVHGRLGRQLSLTLRLATASLTPTASSPSPKSFLPAHSYSRFWGSLRGA